MSKPVRPVYRLYRWLWGSLDLLFPPICGGCGQPGVHWCDNCLRLTKKIKPPICEICGQPMGVNMKCNRCSSTVPQFTHLRSWALYEGPVREAIKRLKYRQNMSLGVILADPLVDLLDDLGWEVDLVIPVPLGVARLRERGYNQAVLIARPLSLRIGTPCLTDGLIRVRDTRSQVGLSFIQRQKNVENAFEGVEKKISGRRVLLVDDVATSSATMNACAGALLAAGAQDVLGLTIARAI